MAPPLILTPPWLHAPYREPAPRPFVGQERSEIKAPRQNEAEGVQISPRTQRCQTHSCEHHQDPVKGCAPPGETCHCQKLCTCHISGANRQDPSLPHILDIGKILQVGGTGEEGGGAQCPPPIPSPGHATPPSIFFAQPPCTGGNQRGPRGHVTHARPRASPRGRPNKEHLHTRKGHRPCVTKGRPRAP